MTSTYLKKKKALTKGFKYRLCLQKAYFDNGLALTGYVKYLIAFFGLASSNTKLTIIFAVVYAFACYFLGRIWINWGWAEENTEVSNRFNKFVKEMRKKSKVPKK